MNEYEKQANDFAKKYGVKIAVLSKEYKKHFADDDQKRWVFKLRLTRNKKQYTFEFGQSIACGETAPTMYDVLACLQKYEIGTFQDFCSDFGYNDDSIRAYKTYKAVLKEYNAVNRLFGDVMDELQEIC